MEIRNRHLPKRAISFLLLLAVSLPLAGCGSGSTSSAALEDGVYAADVTLEGGSGRASVQSPATVTVEDGKMEAEIVWDSEYYDYVIVDGTKYLNENEGGNSTFTIPISGLDTPQEVIADTTRMSVPHEITYTLTFTLAEGEDFSELTQTGSLDLSYATQYQVDYYGAYSLITIVNSEKRYLVVPEGYPVPGGLPDDVTVLQQPLDRVYLVSTSAMDLVAAIGAVPNIRLSGTEYEDWYIEEAAQAMADGDMLYAGKYSQPDYELIVSENCDLAIENTMILHSPEVQEKLEELGIPVVVERSSYENDPLGRLEWIKFYGVLFGREDEAESFFSEQIAKIEPLLDQENTGKTVVFFSVNSNGSITVHKPGDYITKMIDYAGGVYALSDIDVEDDTALSTMKMDMESFYSRAKDADVLIYNSTIEGEIGSIADLTAKNSLFSNFKAVQDGQVYCTSANFFQETTGSCDFIEDLHEVLTGTGDGTYTYLIALS